MMWETARARLAIAEAIGDRHPDLAVREARLAMSGFDEVGAQPGVDQAARLLRRLGVRPAGRGRTGAALSRREEEVARLVGLGMSNDQIAARLFLSQRTVETHVSSILRKLSMASRVEIAAYAARRLVDARAP
jgi:DNA-binding NarL/FixJ family response regulator